MEKSALVFRCCSVTSWGYTTELCWCCGKSAGQDAWKDPAPRDDDAMLARKYISLRDIPLRETSI